MAQKTNTRSFAGGEVSPQLYGRVDLVKNQTGLAKCLNYLVTPQGPIQNRPGLEYVQTVKFSDKITHLIPFRYSDSQTAALEFGEFYVRIHINGSTLLESGQAVAAVTQSNPAVFQINAHSWNNGDWVYASGFTWSGSLPTPAINGRFFRVVSVNTNDFVLTDLFGNTVNLAANAPYVSGGTLARVYEVVTPYSQFQVADIHFVQSGDVMTLVHPSHAPRELKRLSASSWSLSEINFVPTTAAPSFGPSFSANIPGGTANVLRYYYCTTNISATTGEESLPGPIGYLDTDITSNGNSLDVTPQTSAAASAYNIYKLQGGRFGFIGQCDGLGALRDDNIAPDMTRTPPQAATPFADRVITNIPVTAPGSGYGVGGYVTLAVSGALTGTGAVLDTVVDRTTGGIKAVRIINGGSGYTGSVTAAITNAAGGSGATFGAATISAASTESRYPQAVAYFEQRRVFGGSPAEPQKLWATRSGTESSFSKSFPTQADDAIIQRLVAQDRNAIRHLLPLQDLVALSDSAVFRTGAGGDEATTAVNFRARRQGNFGASNVPPAITSNAILYAHNRGNHIRELAYKWESQKYEGEDVSILAAHLFDGDAVVRMAYAQVPTPTLWSVSQSGRLLGMTHVPEHEVKAWHQHLTQGLFRSCAVVPEGDEDVLYAIVERTVNNQQMKYIERMRSRKFTVVDECFFVDSGLSYANDVPFEAVTGLWHIEGRQVSILADGAVDRSQVVTGGTVTLDSPARRVHVGLSYNSDFQTLPLAVEAQAFGQGIAKNINTASIRINATVPSLLFGITFDEGKMTPYELRQVSTNYGLPPGVQSTEIIKNIPTNWTRDTRLCVRQSEPLPVEVLSLTLEVSLG